MSFKSSRPIYAIILLLASIFFMCTTFLPFLYSLAFPNDDLQRFVSALEGREPPSMESETVVQQALAAVGSLKKTIQVGSSYQTVTKIHYAGPQASETIRASQVINIAWFEKHPEPMLMAFTCYANGNGQKAYQISQVSPLVIVRGYAIPLCLFAFSLVLARRRPTGTQAQGPNSETAGT